MLRNANANKGMHKNILCPITIRCLIILLYETLIINSRSQYIKIYILSTHTLSTLCSFPVRLPMNRKPNQCQ